MKKVVGLDIGITSVGYSIIDTDNDELIEFGVRHFEEAKEASEARTYRSARRNLRHKQWRKKQLKRAFVDFEIISEQDMTKKDYAAYHASGNGLEPPKDHTVYHLRKRALVEKVTPRELFLCLYNIAQARGSFTMQNVDFENSKEAISFDMYKELFYSLSECYIEYSDDRLEFEEKVLSLVFEGKLDSQTIKKSIVALDRGICSSKDEDKLFNLIKLIRGYKARLDIISEDLVLLDENGEPKRKNVSIDDLKQLEDQTNEFYQGIIELADMSKVYRVLKDHDYICEIAVEKIDMYNRGYIKDSEGNDNSVSELLQKKEKGHIRSIKNTNNTYPNGLYLKEARAILRKQQEFYGDKITDAFIEICISNLASRIPYYIGPLSMDAKNAWLDRKDEEKFTYSYNYSQEKLGIVNEFSSIRNWKRRMVSHCTYLPEYIAMPKGSFIGETFSIVNEMNLYMVTDTNGDDRHLTYQEKKEVFNKLFLKQKRVNFSEVIDLLGLSYYGPRDVTSMKAFNNFYSIYFQIKQILPELEVKDIEEIFADKQKIERIESVILDLNLFNEEESKARYFMDPDNGYSFSKEVAKKLSKIKSKGYYSLSREFVMDYKIDGYHSILDCLFNTDHEQMYLITHATDKNGEIVDLTANKYEKIMRDKPNLSFDLLIDGERPVIPVSRPVIRALNEALKVYNQIIEYYGVPDRLVIETARELNDKSKTKKKSVARKDRIEKVYKDLINQKEFSGMLEKDWEKVENQLNKNSQKIELYVRQAGRDLISGRRIDIDHLDEYEIDHILPVGFGDDSMDNKELIHREVNRYKKNRLPLEFIESGDGRAHGIPITAKQFIDNINALHAVKIGDDPLISKKKCKMLLMRDSSDVEGFIDQNIVDTRYIIKEFMSIIKAYNKVNGIKTHVSALKAAYTDMYRNGLGIIKDRDAGLQHHAVDATVIAIADTCLNKRFPHYDERKSSIDYYSYFKELIVNSLDSDAKDNDFGQMTLRRNIKSAFRSAFGIDNTHSKLLSKMKGDVPLFSEKVLKNHRGAFFGATLYKVSDIKDLAKDVLTILGINNKEHVFTGVNCAAVDFYKISKTKKDKIIREHVAIHIPKVIVDNDGNIDKEKYIKLIVDHYKKPELLTEDGEINQKLFRFRAYKNDIIYDTFTKEPQLFILGSIALKKLEMKTINIFSYDKIMDMARRITEDIIVHFDIKMLNNKKGSCNFNDLDRKSLIEYVLETFYTEGERERYGKAIFSDEMLQKLSRISDFSRRVAVLAAWVEKTNLPPTIQGRYQPVANNDAVTKDPDAEYVKLKYNVLGLRFAKNKDGALIITGPNRHENAYTKVKHEDFSWRL